MQKRRLSLGPVAGAAPAMHASNAAWRVDDRAWCHDDEAGFVLCTVTSATADKVSVRDAQGRDGELKPDELYPVNPASQDGSRDNTELMYLQEPHMLHNLAHRYARDAIYTYTAHILIACNPFKRLPLYGEKQMRAYQGKSLGMMEPHVYAVADRAYRSMSHYKMSQAVIISGESGSGKTETAKIVMAFLTWAGGSQKGSGGGSVEKLAERILQANPILEAFGNARTLRNDNSSRFGKFTKMLFGADGAIDGATISTYLLEKSRLIHHAPGERGYHAFYQLLAGAPKEKRKTLWLGEVLERREMHHFVVRREPNALERGKARRLSSY